MEAMPQTYDARQIDPKGRYRCPLCERKQIESVRNQITRLKRKGNKIDVTGRETKQVRMTPIRIRAIPEIENIIAILNRVVGDFSDPEWI